MYAPEPFTVAMNPLLDEELRRVDVSERWLALLELDGDAGRAELTAAKVAQRTINALLPADFSDFAPKLTQYFKKQRPQTKYDADWWGYHSDAVERLNALLPKEMNEFRAAELSEFVGSEAYEQLHLALRKKLGTDNRLKRASAMISCLWNMHWHMAHLSESNLPRQRVHARFASIFDWVLPTLLSTAAAA